MIPEHLYVDTPPMAVAGLAYYPKTESLMNLMQGTDRFGEPYVLYREVLDKVIGIPRGLARVAPDHKNDARTTGVKVKYGLSKENKPRNAEQKRVIAESYALLKAGKSHIIEGSTGFGKTYVGLTLAGMLSRKLLIVVQKEDLLAKWRIDALKFLDVTEDDIGVIQGDKCDVDGKKVVIGMVQTLFKDKHGMEVYEQFGLVIFDEVHHMAADKFSIAAGLFNADLRLGLSATTERQDGRTFIFEAHIGPVAVRTKFIPLPPKILVIKTKWQCPRVPRRVDGEWKMVRMPHEHGKLGAILKSIASDPARNALIVGCVVQAHKKGRNILVLSDLARKLHLDVLHALLIRAGIPEKDIGFYVGGMSEKALEAAKSKRVVLATYAMAGEATDVPWWDTVVFASPRAQIRQALGRILREYPGKVEPVAFDLRDGDSEVLNDYYYAREKQYLSAELHGKVVQAHL